MSVRSRVIQFLWIRVFQSDIFGFSHVFLSSGGLTFTSVKVTATCAASEARIMTIIPSASIVFAACVEAGLESHGTAFFDCGNMGKLFSPVKLIPKKMSTDSL